MRDDTLFKEWKALAKKVDILAAARKHGRTLKRQGRAEWVGPCRACGGRDRFGVNTRKQWFNCRGFGGGDVIKMVMHLEGVDFNAACELLTGTPPPRGESTLDRAEIARRRERLERESAERATRQAREQAEDDERRRARAWEMYRCGVSARGTVVTRYLEARSIDPYSPATRRLRFLPDTPFWYAGDDGQNRIIHSGPAMMSAIQGVDGRFLGIHLTWLADDGSDKAEIFAPGTDKKLKVKKFRGLVKGGAIRLTGDVPGDVLLIGEGKETTWSVYDPLRRQRPDLSLAAWAAASLGNLGGGGKGPEPDMDNPGFLPPVWAKTILILGDGDSDPAKVREQTERCRRRCAYLNHAAAVAMAEPDKDFNDMLRGM